MKKFIIYLTLILVITLVGFTIYSNAIKTGITLREHSKYLEYAYYGIIILVCFILIIRPMLIIAFTPHYSVAKYCDESQSNDGGLRRRAKRVYRHGRLDDESKQQLIEAIKSRNKTILSQRMFIIYNNQIKKNIDKIVQDCSRDILYLTAISQNHFADMLMVLTNNFRMVKKIILMCGFRPTFLRVCKIYINIFAMSLIADGAQKIEVSTLLNSSIRGGLKLLADSAANGAINAFTTLRVGMLTKQYLYADPKKSDKVKIKNIAIAEAAKMFPSIIASLLTSPIKSVGAIFNKKPNTVNQEHEQVLEEIPDEVDWKWKNK